MLKREMELMREYVNKVGIRHIILTNILVLLLIIIIESFATFNIQMLDLIGDSASVLRTLFSVIAVFVAVFTIIANIIFDTSHGGKDKEFRYYFHIRPLLVYSFVAIAGDVVAIFLAHNTGYPYIVFFTSLIALNIIAIVQAAYSAEKALKRGI